MPIAKCTTSTKLLQRSPTYMLPAPAVDDIANRLRQMLPEQFAYDFIRWTPKNNSLFT